MLKQSSHQTNLRKSTDNTISMWVKRSTLLTGSDHQEVLSAFATDQFGFRFQGDNKLDIFDYSVSGNNYPLRLLRLNSQFIFLIYSIEISLGHSASQAPVLVQCPNPSSSIFETIFLTLSSLSGSP